MPRIIRDCNKVVLEQASDNLIVQSKTVDGQGFGSPRQKPDRQGGLIKLRGRASLTVGLLGAHDPRNYTKSHEPTRINADLKRSRFSRLSQLATFCAKATGGKKRLRDSFHAIMNARSARFRHPAKPETSRRRPPRYQPYPRLAASMAATSIFFIDIIAEKARFASAPPAAIASVSTRGVICQERPQRSLHQPHALS